MIRTKRRGEEEERGTAAAESEVSEKRKECGEWRKEIERHARISNRQVLHQI